MASFGQTDREGRHALTRSRAALGRDCGFPLADRHCNVPLDRRELQRHGNPILVTVERQKVTFCPEPDAVLGFARSGNRGGSALRDQALAKC
jgi:hypothetical protein